MLTVKLNTENDAFGDGNGGAEIARILRRLADAIEDGSSGPGTLNDANGNRVGSWTLSIDAQA